MEKLNWMLGMTDNMMNMTVDNPLTEEMYGLTSSMMGNLNYMRLHKDMLDSSMINMMEQMMRNMEGTMQGMDMMHEGQRLMMQNMMRYMIMMQMDIVMSMMNK